MNPCSKYRQLFSPDFSGELGPARKRELEAHLNECGACHDPRMELAESERLLTAGVLFPPPRRSTEDLILSLHRDIGTAEPTLPGVPVRISREPVPPPADRIGPTGSRVFWFLLGVLTTSVAMTVMVSPIGTPAGNSLESSITSAGETDPDGMSRGPHQPDFNPETDQQIDVILGEIEQMDREFEAFKDKAHKLGIDQERVFVDRRMPEWE